MPNNLHSCITCQAFSYKAYTSDSPYRSPYCACVFLRYNGLQVFPFKFSSQAFTGLDTSLDAMVGQMLRFKENTNKCTTLHYKVFTITIETYTSLSQDSNDYNTVSVYDPFHRHTYTSTAPTSRHQTILI